MTVKEVLENTVTMLSQVCVPVGMMHSVGEPIAAAIGNLTVCVRAMEEAESKGDEKTDAS